MTLFCVLISAILVVCIRYNKMWCNIEDKTPVYNHNKSNNKGSKKMASTNNNGNDTTSQRTKIHISDPKIMDNTYSAAKVKFTNNIYANIANKNDTSISKPGKIDIKPTKRKNSLSEKIDIFTSPTKPTYKKLDIPIPPKKPATNKIDIPKSSKIPSNKIKQIPSTSNQNDVSTAKVRFETHHKYL